jgi:cell division septal protein FtsQ
MKKYVFSSVLLIGITAFGYLIYSIPNFINVREIICKSQYGSCNSDLTETLVALKGKSIRIAKGEITKSFSNDLGVESFLIKYVLPNNLKVEVVERKGMYAIQKTDSDGVFIVNEEGKIISTSDSTGLPRLIYIVGDFAKGDMVTDEIMFALKILSDMNYLYKVKEAKFDTIGVIMSLGDGVDVIFPLSGDKDVAVGGLVLIYSQLKADSENTRMKDVEKPLTIDMRYRNPVIRNGNVK